MAGNQVRLEIERREPFAVGPATVNSKLRNLGTTLREMESGEPTSVPSRQPSR